MEGAEIKNSKLEDTIVFPNSEIKNSEIRDSVVDSNCKIEDTGLYPNQSENT
ncbi:MAG: hypothetical protein ABEJ95_07315 [Candidatus Nanohalobium sp.]